MRRSAESIWNGHTPVERIYYDGMRMNCDLGSNTYSVISERALGIVNLTEMTYLVYKQAGKTLEKRRIGRY
jgi:serine/threonine protein phosphatase 1